MSKVEQPEILDEKYFLESANDSARHFRTIYTVYLILLFYTAVTILSTDQELLFRAIGKQLPVVNINAPIVAFYVVMPWGLLSIHFYLLIQSWFLADKVRLYLQELKKPGFKYPGKAQKLLFPVPLAHILTGTKGQLILRSIIVISLIIFPIVVLIGAQITFLPYQSEVITWQHRIVIMLDIGMLWYFWKRRIFLSKNKKVNEGKWLWRLLVFIARFIFRLILLASTLLVIVFIVVYADFPSTKWYSSETSKFHRYMENSKWIKDLGASKMMLNHFELSRYTLVKREPSPEILASYSPKDIEQTSDENAAKKSSIRPGSAIWCEYAEPLDLTARNFREANLRGAILCGATLSETNFSDANLRMANLTEAELWRANLTEANFAGADLRRANLSEADLTEASFTEANLTKADLQWAKLTEANFTEADLRRANLTSATLITANLTEADLRRANLSEADLTEAELSWANLTDADLIRANLTEADLIKANLTDADLIRANLTEAELSGAKLTEANLAHANLTEADLLGAKLTEADLAYAKFTEADLTGANLIDADLFRANLTDADLIRANLTDADLTWADFRGANLSNAVLWGVNLRGANFTSATVVETQIDHSWVREGPTENKEQYFPIGIPRNWDTTIKPDYLCLSDFNVADHINFVDYVGIFGFIREEKEAELKEKIKEILEQECKPYEPHADEN